ncbi:MAG: serine hydrolase [Hyphomicrobiales bacterium]|nr:serine hydrolase [Hyphomicrobiales bacterium]
MKPFLSAAAIPLATCLASMPAGAATSEAVATALAELRTYAEKLIADDEVPGLAIAVVHGDEIVFLEGFGVRVEGSDQPVDADTVFQIASLSKPISSTIVAALVSQDLVSWDSRMADIDPSFQLLEPYATATVTVADLFAHNSGLAGLAGNELESIGYDRDEILRRLRLVEPWTGFRGGYSYSNFGLTAGAEAAAGAAGMSWDEAAETMLFKPLGMASTSVSEADFRARENRAELHVPSDGAWRPLSKRHPDPQAPAGGVSSNVRDLAQWLRLQLASGEFGGEQLIAEDAFTKMHTPATAHGVHPVTGRPSFYGLGWGVSYTKHGVVWSHAGAFSKGARTFAEIYPKEDLGIVVLANAFPTGVPEAVADTFFDLVFDGAPSKDWLTEWNGRFDFFRVLDEQAKQAHATRPEPHSPALPASAYAGTYSNDYVGTAIVSDDSGTPTLAVGPDGARTYELTHFDRDLFLYYPFDESPDTPYEVSFAIDATGQAARITIEHLDDVGLGTLARDPD